MKMKNPGLSLMISLGASMLVLGIAVAVLSSVSKSLEQSGNVQRSNQLFYAAESGVESALFHHNARGAGTHFADPDIEYPASSGDFPQNLSHPTSSTKAKWKIEGQTQYLDNTGSMNALMGLLREGESISIPLAWDTSTNPKAAPNNSGSLAVNEDFILTFYGSSDSQIPSGNNLRSNFETQFGGITDLSVEGIDFGHANNEILIDWSLSATHSTNGIQTFIPIDNTDCLNLSAGFICDNQIINTAATNLSINSSLPINGKILPGNSPDDLSSFFNDANRSDFKITFRALLPFEGTNNKKTPGIPFVLKTPTTKTPLPTYTITSTVTQGDFSQEVIIKAKEKTSIGAFDYVIFD